MYASYSLLLLMNTVTVQRNKCVLMLPRIVRPTGAVHKVSTQQGWGRGYLICVRYTKKAEEGKFIVFI